MPIAGKRAQPENENDLWRNYLSKKKFIRTDFSPTELEIAEGKAHKHWTLHPANREAQQAWEQAYLSTLTAQGTIATTRCSRCHVVRVGRSPDDPCGNCGLKQEPFWREEEPD